jgi:type IV pilus assembly protein PilN
MYSLDVNFLTDRNLELKGPAVAVTADGPSLQQQLPIYIGAGVMVVLPLLAGLSLLFVGWQKEQAQANIQTLEAELAKLNAQNKKIQEIQGKTKTIDDDIAGLVGVFNQIKPWSAILQDLTDQTPATVQISGIQQADRVLTLTGFSRNYADLNDFLLTLQNSRFFKADNTKLVTATANPLPITGVETDSGGGATAPQQPASGAGDKPAGPTVTVPTGVKYTITTELSDTPDNELMSELTRKGAIGLVTRFKILEQKGIMSPQKPTDPIVSPVPPGTPPPAGNPQTAPAPPSGEKKP